MKPDYQAMKNLLAESIRVLCKNGLQYRTKFSIQGLLGITIDDDNIFLVDIHEKVNERKQTRRSDPSDSELESRASCIKSSRRSRHDARRGKKRKKARSSVSSSSSPEHSADESGLPTKSDVPYPRDHSLRKLEASTSDTCSSFTQRTTVNVSAANIPDQCALQMDVEQVEDYSQDISQLPANMSRPSDLQGNPENRRTKSNNTPGTRDKISMIQNDRKMDDDFVIVKEEKMDATPDDDVDLETLRSYSVDFDQDVFSPEVTQNSEIGSQNESGVAVPKPFQYAQPYPPVSNPHCTPSDQTSPYQVYTVTMTSSITGHRKKQVRFNTRMDIDLLRMVLAENPFINSQAWRAVAAKLDIDVDSRRCRERTNLLLTYFRDEDWSSLRRNSQPDEYQEKQKLLTKVDNLCRRAEDARQATSNMLSKKKTTRGRVFLTETSTKEPPKDGSDQESQDGGQSSGK